MAKSSQSPQDVGPLLGFVSTLNRVASLNNVLDLCSF